MLTSRRTQAAWGDRRPAGGLSQPPGPHRHVHLLPPCPSPSCHQPQGEAGRQSRALKILHETPRASRRLRLPGTRLAQPPSSPAKAWHRCPRQPLSLPASPRGPRARADCFTAAGSAQLPREKAPLFPAPVAPAWLGDTRAPGGKVTGPRRIHLQPHQLPGNRIPAADDSRRRQDRAPIQPPLDGVARPGGRLPNLGPPTPGHRVPRASTAQTVRPPARGHGRGQRAAMHPTLGARDR